jgi:hypothetical protein
MDTRRETTMKLLKPILIALSLLAGALFLYEGFGFGFGFGFRILDYQPVAEYGIPIGIAFIVMGVLIGRFLTTS